MLHALIVAATPLRGSLLERCFEAAPYPARLSVVTAPQLPQTLDASLRSPDLIILDHAEPLVDRLDALQTVRLAQPQARIIVSGVPSQGTPGRAEIILRYFEYGAAGYVSADEPCARLLAVVEEVSRGETRVDPPVTTELVRRIAELRQVLETMDPHVFEGEPADLTPRQQEVLALVAEGLTNQEIADRLYISVGTVKNHVHSILESLNVTSREQAAQYFHLMQREGLAA